MYWNTTYNNSQILCEADKYFTEISTNSTVKTYCLMVQYVNASTYYCLKSAPAGYVIDKHNITTSCVNQSFLSKDEVWCNDTCSPAYFHNVTNADGSFKGKLCTEASYCKNGTTATIAAKNETINSVTYLHCEATCATLLGSAYATYAVTRSSGLCVAPSDCIYTNNS